MTQENTNIAELAAQIKSKTLELDNYYKTNDLPAPSMSAGALAVVPLPLPLVKVREEILAANAELQALIAGPLGHITRVLSPTVSMPSRTIELLVMLAGQRPYRPSSNLPLQDCPRNRIRRGSFIRSDR